MVIGILGGADIAYNMFIPSTEKIAEITQCVVASNSIERRDRFKEKYNIQVVDDYNAILDMEEIECVYIPLPPALHFKWAKKALQKGKHVLIEKPSAVSYEQTNELVKLARENGVALHENYMFKYHNQLDFLDNLLRGDKLGKITLVRSSFGFPFRGDSDFRYNDKLGGGALLDAGGYVIKLATILLGNDLKLDSSYLQVDKNYNVDMFGAFTFHNSDGILFQGSYGTRNSYQCSVELWGTRGRVYTNRIFTAKPDYNPVYEIECNNTKETVTLERDNHFEKSIRKFISAIYDPEVREALFNEILLQALLVDRVGKGNKVYEE